MDSSIRWILIIPITIAIIFNFIGCFQMASEYRAKGFSYFKENFSQFPSTPYLYEEIEIEKLKVIIVGSREHFNWTKARKDSNIKAYATRKNEIYIFGKRVGDKIVINQAILGHELNHILNFNNPKFADPHQLENIELCVLGNGKC